MLLLFNKVYLKNDHLFKSDRERIYISPRLTRDIAVGTIRHTVDGVTARAPLLHASSYDELIRTEFNGNEDELFAYMYQYPAHKRLTVYCDVDAMVKIATKFWKTLFPRLPAEIYWVLLDSMLSHTLDTVATHRSTESFVSNAQVYDMRDEIEDAFQRRQELTDGWASVRGFTVDRTQREHLLKTCGAELQLPTVLVNPKWRYANTVKHKFERMAVKRFVADLTVDLKHAMLLNVERLSSMDAQYAFDALTDDLDSFVALHPELRFLTDDMFTPDHVDHVVATYDIYALAQLHGKFNTFQAFKEEQIAAIMSQPLTFDRLLELHLTDQYGAMLGYGGEFREKVNPRVIDFVVAAYRAADLTTLNHLELK